MTTLLELREKIKLIYSKNEVFILPVVKFLLAFIVFNTLNAKLGYMTRLDNIAIVLIVSLLCSFLPMGFMLLFGILFSLLHMYALSMEVALVGVCVYLLIFLLFLRLSPKDSLVVLLTVLLCSFKVPYIMPIAMGLIGSPMAAVSVACGVVIYYLLLTVVNSAGTIGTMEASDVTEKIRLIIDGILGNKAMIVMVTAFVITVIVVYLLRRMSIDYSWTIAMVTGAMINIVILLIGDLLYDTKNSVFTVILGSVLAVGVSKVIEFFRFCVDYSRTEKVQFEDDEYYYYVKAVPKIYVTASAKTVKRINEQRREPQTGRMQGNSNVRNRMRNVETEYIPGARGNAAVNSRTKETSEEDYEDLL